MDNYRRKTGIFDKNKKEVLEGDIISLDCNCCFYKVIFDQEKNCWWPKEDKCSQVHLEHINVWNLNFEIIEDVKDETVKWDGSDWDHVGPNGEGLWEGTLGYGGDW